MTIDEINARLSAIAGEIDGAEGDALTALESEVDSLTEQRKALMDDIQSRQQLRAKIANGEIKTEIIESEEREMPERTFSIESMEYRNAWLKKLQGQKLSEDEARAYATTDSHTAIPTITSNVFFEKMKKLAPMLSEITLMQVAGNLKFVAQGTVNAASKHTENNSVSAAADTVVSVTLGAVEFMKVIGISKSASAMSPDAFESWLVEMLAGDIARAVDNYIINDSSNGISAITYTTNTNQVLQTATTGYKYADILSLIALLPAAYDAEAKFLVNKATLYNNIASIVDSNGRPIFVPDTVNGFGGRLMGFPVLVDDYVSTSNGALYLGRFKDVVGNMSIPLEVDRDESSGFLSGTINYRGFAAFDSKPAKTDAIVRLVTTA